MPWKSRRNHPSVPADMEVGSAAWNKLVAEGVGTLLNVEVSPLQLERFAVHIQELLLWNRKTNLTAITDPAEAAVKHVVDSLAPAGWIPPGSTVLDVGSGGGFPGIPLKILMPSLSVTLIEASRKKNSFQRQVIRRLNLNGITALQERIEIFSTLPDRRGTFSVIVCRAFADLAGFIETAAPLMKPGGMMIAMKGDISDDERKDAEAVIARRRENEKTLQLRIVPYRLPYLNAGRYLYIVS